MTKPSLVDKVRATGIVGLTSASVALATTGVVHAQINDGLNAADPKTVTTDLSGLIHNIINILLYIVGVAAVVMMIIGGIRYIVSGGDQQAVTNAKNTILYSIVGLVIAMLAFVAVNYVFSTVGGASGSGTSTSSGSSSGSSSGTTPTTPGGATTQ